MSDSNSQLGQRVIVAMSGGVDSSVAAALLKEQGYDVIGISLKLWDYDEDERKLSGKTCCSLDDIADAKDVCDTLGIPFYAFNHKPEFRKSVIETFVEEYRNGRTPNPCVLCNQFIKFDVLLNEARKMGSQYLATGHYARIVTSADGNCHLMKGKDNDKDQSYVLHHLSQDDLKRVLFPIGEYSKAEIRELARKYNLITHSKRESMEICFIPNNDHAAFIAKNYPDQKRKSGQFVDWQGRKLGEHEGIDKYTVGQRRGLKVAMGERMFVAQIRPDTDEVVLAREDDLYFDGATADSFHVIQALTDKTYGAKIRYQRDEIPCRVVRHDGASHVVEVEFLEPARAVTPGQALVIYDGDEVVGGGWIQQSIRRQESLVS